MYMCEFMHVCLIYLQSGELFSIPITFNRACLGAVAECDASPPLCVYSQRKNKAHDENEDLDLLSFSFLFRTRDLLVRFDPFFHNEEGVY